MQFEVEQKFLVSDLSALEHKLASAGAVFVDTIVQVDRYLAHPSRDFAQTDEALRIRQVGDANFITYKGPKIDTTTKTRKEIELPLHDGGEEAERWVAIFAALGFAPVAQVRKQRRCGQLLWQNAEVEIALDHVDELGDFVELELSAEESSVDEAKATIQSLADELGLAQSERRSYLELILEKLA